MGIPSLLIGFIIFGICSIPEGEYEDYSESDDSDHDHDDGDVSSEHDSDDDQTSIRHRRPAEQLDEHSNTATTTTESSKDK